MTRFQIIIKRFLLNKGSAFGGIFLSLIIIGAIFAPIIAPYDWNAIDAGPRLSGPSLDYLFGTDLHGRDVFSRIIYGARYSLSVGVISVLFGIISGSIFGISIAYIGGRVDIIGSRIIDVMFGFPSFLLSLLVVAIIGVGLNVNQIKFKHYSLKATSMKKLLEKKFDIEELQKELIYCIELRYLQLKRKEFVKIREEYSAVLYGFNQWRYYEIEGGKIKAKLQELMKSACFY